MSKKKELEQKEQQAEERISAVEEALSKSELFIENNKKPILIGLIILVVVVAGIFGYKKFISEPNNKEAQAMMFHAQQSFESEDWNTALNGKGEQLGFLAVIDEYGSTPAGNLCKYYAGVCYMQLGNFDDAIEYLKKYSGKDEIISSQALGLIADAYLEKGENKEAISYYRKAINNSSNEFTCPMYLKRLAAVYELEGNYKDALPLYERIRDEFIQSLEAQDVEKLIANAQNNIK